MRTKNTLDKTVWDPYNGNVEDMFRKISICSITLLALLAVNCANAVGLEVGAFGGMAVPFWNMYRVNGRNLGVSPEIGANASINISSKVAISFSTAYHFNHGTRQWPYPDYKEMETSVYSVKIGPCIKLLGNNTTLSAAIGVGYYRITHGPILPKNETTFNAIGSDTEVYINALGIYFEPAFSYPLGRIAISTRPSVNYVFDKGTYSPDEPYFERTIKVKTNDIYIELLFGLTYELF